MLGSDSAARTFCKWLQKASSGSPRQNRTRVPRTRPGAACLRLRPPFINGGRYEGPPGALLKEGWRGEAGTPRLSRGLSWAALGGQPAGATAMHEASRVVRIAPNRAAAIRRD